MSDLHDSPAAIIKMCFIAKAPQNVWAKSIIQKLGLNKKTRWFLLWLSSHLIKYETALFISSSHLFLTWKILPMQHERIQSVRNKWWMHVEMEREWWVYAEKGRKKERQMILRSPAALPLNRWLRQCTGATKERLTHSIQIQRPQSSRRAAQ